MLDQLPKDAKVQLQIKSENKIEAIVIKEKNSDKNRLFPSYKKRQCLNCLFLL